jgi:Protein of unknown function (DUF3168)
MSLAIAVYPALSSFSGLTALVGARVYPVIAQSQVSYPYVVYSSVFSTPQNSLGGWSGGDNLRLQVDCWAKTYAAADAVADQVRAAMAQANAAYRAVCIGVLDGPVEAGLDLYHIIVEFSLWSS